MVVDLLRWACDVPLPTVGPGVRPGPTDRLILTQLARYLELHDDGVVRAKVLAHMAGVSDRTVRDSLNVLRACRLIEMIPSPGRAPVVRLRIGSGVESAASDALEPVSGVRLQAAPPSEHVDSGTGFRAGGGLPQPVRTEVAAGSAVRGPGGDPALANTPEPTTGVAWATAGLPPVELPSSRASHGRPRNGVLPGTGEPDHGRAFHTRDTGPLPIQPSGSASPSAARRRRSKSNGAGLQPAHLCSTSLPPQPGRYQGGVGTIHRPTPPCPAPPRLTDPPGFIKSCKTAPLPAARPATPASALPKHPPATPMGEVAVFAQDVKVKRSIPSAQGKRRGADRKPVKEFSKRSWRALRHLLRNGPPLSHHVTLTYPDPAPTDGDTVKSHLRKIERWLKERFGRMGAWVLEFQKRGAPHLHILLDGNVPRTQLAQKWSHTIDPTSAPASPPCTRIEKVCYPVRLTAYLLKLESKTVPEGYEHVGRFWGRFGGYQARPTDVLRGELLAHPGEGRTDVAKTIAVIRNHARAKARAAGRRSRPDRGMAGFTVEGAGPAARELLGKQRHLPPPDGRPTPAPTNTSFDDPVAEPLRALDGRPGAAPPAAMAIPHLGRGGGVSSPPPFQAGPPSRGRRRRRARPPVGQLTLPGCGAESEQALAGAPPLIAAHDGRSTSARGGPAQ